MVVKMLPFVILVVVGGESIQKDSFQVQEFDNI